MPISVDKVARTVKQGLRMTLRPSTDDTFKREIYLLLCAAEGVDYTDDITPEMKKYLNIKS